MPTPEANQVTVSFPAHATFSRLGRVSVGGLATRLAIDITRVEELRLAADAASLRLVGEGRITVTSQWNEDELTVRLDNPLAELNEEDFEGSEPTLNGATYVERIVEPPSRIFLRVLRRDPPEPTPEEDDLGADSEDGSGVAAQPEHSSTEELTPSAGVVDEEK